MRSSGLSRIALSNCIAAAMLAGCGVLPFDSAQGRLAQDDTQPPIGASGAMLQASAQSPNFSSTNYRGVYSFGAPPDGSNPQASLIDVHGTLYGTTSEGGAHGYGTVFSLDPTTRAENVLHSFGSRSSDGEAPVAALISVNGRLYGTTIEGGAHGAGTVFSLNPATGAENVLHSFGSHSSDGEEPYAGLIDVKGTLYGTTTGGGANGYGAVFSLNPTTRAERVLYSFGGGSSDGEVPYASLISVNGTFYGTTSEGGAHGAGTVFSLNPATGAESVLHSFGYRSGEVPVAGLISVKGTFYGTTSEAGHGYGAVFSLNPTTGAERVLHSFGRRFSDGEAPYAGLMSVNGMLYGTTSKGGAHGDGTVFSLNPTTGVERVLHSFGSRPGRVPVAGLISVKGTFYGTTSEGGAHGYGTVFAVSP